MITTFSQKHFGQMGVDMLARNSETFSLKHEYLKYRRVKMYQNADVALL